MSFLRRTLFGKDCRANGLPKGNRRKTGKPLCRNGHARSLRIEPLEERSLLSVGVGGMVWSDANQNGIREAGELGVAGAVVEIHSSPDGVIGNSDDVLLGTAITDANGDYSFSNLPAGANFYEIFRAPVGYTFTTQNAGGDATLDSDASVTGVTGLLAVEPGTTDLTHDAGLVGAAPGFGWALSVGSPGESWGYSMAIDTMGSVYAVGNIRGTVDVDPGPGTYFLDSVHSTGLYIAKYSSAGALVWAGTVGGEYCGVRTQHGIAISPDGNVYVTGTFEGTVDFDPGVSEYCLTSQANDYKPDSFVMKWDAGGNFVWAKSFTGHGDQIGTSIAVGADGSAYTTGYFESTIDLDPGAETYNLTCNVSHGSMYISKLDASGNFVWGRSIDTSAGETSYEGIGLGEDGSVYTTGCLGQTADLDPGPGVFTLPEAGTAFVSKMDSNGNFVWARGITRSDGSGYVGPSHITTGVDHSIYITGTVVDAYLTDVFIAKIASSGDLLWTKTMGGSNWDRGNGIAIDTDGSVFTTGTFTGVADFDPGPGIFEIVGPSSSTSAFVSKLDGDGNFVWAKCFDDIQEYVDASAIVTGLDGSVYLTGSFAGIRDFDPSEGAFDVTSNSDGGTSGFVLKLLRFNGPADVSLSNCTVVEGWPIGTRVGDFSTANVEPGATFTYALVPGEGSEDNDSFFISGCELRTYAALDASVRSSHSIRVQAKDYAGQAVARALTITIEPSNPANTFSVGGRMWNDLNANGVQDADDSGLAGGVVQVFSSTDGTIGNEDDLLCGTIITGTDGGYSIDGLLRGPNYYQVFRTPAGYAFTTQHVGYDSLLDSDVGATGATRLFTAASNEAGVRVDAGVVGTASGFGFALSAGAVARSASGNSLAIDASGNVYVTGSFGGIADFDPGPGTFNLTSVPPNISGGDSIYVAKYTSAGALVWARSVSPSVLGDGTGITVSADGSVCITGNFRGTADFDPGPGTCNLTSNDGFGIFVLKLSSSGNFAWAKAVTGSDPTTELPSYRTGGGHSTCIAAAPDGSIYTAGSFSGIVDFDPGDGILNLSSAGSQDIFVSKLSCDGNLIWARSMGGTKLDSAEGIALASDGSVLITGGFDSDVVDFNPGADEFSLVRIGVRDAFVCKLDFVGDFVWAKSIGGTATTLGMSLALDSSGNVCLSGLFEGATDFNPGPEAFNLDSSDGHWDIFVCKWDSEGVFDWANSVRRDGTDELFCGIAAGADGSLYVSYCHAYFMKLYTKTVLVSTTTILNLAPDGDTVWSKSIEATMTVPSGSIIIGGNIPMGPMGPLGAIALDGDNNLFVTGCFSGTADFDPSQGVFNVNSIGANDLFVSKLLSFSGPTDVSLSNSTTEDGQPVGATVGTFAAVTTEPGSAIWYSLVSGDGSDDNDSFAIVGSELRTDAVLDAHAKSSCHIRVRATDYASQSVERIFTIEVGDHIAPLITISDPSYVPGTAARTYAYTVTYDDANFDGSTLKASDVTLHRTGTAKGTVTVDQAQARPDW